MCQKTPSFSRNWSSSFNSGSKLIRFAVFLIIFYIAHNAAGGYSDRPAINKKKISSCLNYGHSCWGAHGKRMDPASKNIDIKDDMPNSDVPIDTRWFLSRLAATPFRITKNREIFKDADSHILPRETDIGETIPMKHNIPEEDTLDYQDFPPVIEAFYPEELRTKAWNEKLKFLNFLKSQKLN